jgi:hypothetical protein
VESADHDRKHCAAFGIGSSSGQPHLSWQFAPYRGCLAWSHPMVDWPVNRFGSFKMAEQFVLLYFPWQVAFSIALAWVLGRGRLVTKASS